MSFLKPLEAPGESDSFQVEEKHVYGNPQEEMIRAIVVQDFTRAQAFSNLTALSSRLDLNEQLYLFQVNQTVWDGTNMRRAAIGVPLVLEHVSALNGQVMDTLFEEQPPFYAEGYPDDMEDDSRAAVALLSWGMNISEAEEELEAGAHSGLLHGTGIWKAYWRKKHGYLCPKLEFVERKHIFVDPSLRRPDIRRAKYVIHRMVVSARQLDKMRGVPGYKNIPSFEELKKLGVEPREEVPRSSIEANGTSYSSMSNMSEFDAPEREKAHSIDPANTPLELLEYVNDDFIWTVLQRKILIREDKNPKSKVRYFNTYFERRPGQFDGIGIAQLNGNEQLLQQGLINLQLDYMQLSAHGMFKIRRGSSIMPQMTRVRPGGSIYVDNMEDVDIIKLPPVDPQLFQTVEASDQRASRRSGANEVAVQGAFPQSSGGIGRTAFGMNMLAQGSSGRIRKYVKVIESQVLIPFLEFQIETWEEYLKPEIVKEILSEELEETLNATFDAVVKAGAKLKFKMVASTKMKRRAAMLQSVPALAQFVQSPEIQASLKSQFKVLETDEVIDSVFDMTGWPSKVSWIRDMTPEEQQLAMTDNEMVREMTMLRERLRLETDAKIKTIEAEHFGRAGRSVLESALESKQGQQAAEDQLDQLFGARAAEEELASEMRRMGLEPEGGATGATQQPSTPKPPNRK